MAMGTDAYTHVFVGVRVDDSAFWTEHAAEEETCPQGHVRQDGQGAFCDQEGEKFVARTVRKPTEGFKRVVELMGWASGGETWEAGWDVCYQGLWDEDRLFNANSVTSNCEDRDAATAIGKKVLDIGSYGEGRDPKSLDQNELEEAFGSVKELCETLGVPYKPELFGQLYWSV